MFEFLIMYEMEKKWKTHSAISLWKCVKNNNNSCLVSNYHDGGGGGGGGGVHNLQSTE